MDDGTRMKNSQGQTCNYTINTQNFTYTEQELLTEVLFKNFELLVNIHRDGIKSLLEHVQ